MQHLKNRINWFLYHPRTEVLLILFIVSSIFLLVLEIQLERAGKTFELVRIMGEAITILFVIELSLRYWVAKNKSRFFKQYWVDILAVIPLPFLRSFRLLRVLRLLRLIRLGILMHRRLNAVSSSMAASVGVHLGILCIVTALILLGGLGVHILEGEENPAFKSLGDSFWWSVLSLAAGEPIGGEAQTLYGRLITLGLILGGLTLFAVSTGVVSAIMIERLRKGLEGKEMGIDELQDHIVICGWNRAGHLIIDEFFHTIDIKGTPVVVVAEDLEKAKEELTKLDSSWIYLLRGDYTRMELLEEAGIRNAAYAILLADKSLPRSDQDRDARTVLAALTIEKLNPKIFTCAQLLDRRNNVQLQVAGVENIVIDDEVSGHLLASSIRNRGLISVITELMDIKVGNNLCRLPLPASWQGLSYFDALQRLKSQYDALLVGIERRVNAHRETLVNPDGKMPLLASDHLVLVAKKTPEID